MEDLRRQCQNWTHDNDTVLLKFLQGFSTQLTDQIAACRTAMGGLSQVVADLSADIGRADSAVSLLSNAKFLEKQVEESDDLLLPRAAPLRELPAAAPPAQGQRERQAAILQGIAALRYLDVPNPHARPLPHIYGSAEYLQDSQAGLGTPASPYADDDAALAAAAAGQSFLSDPATPQASSDGDVSELESMREFSQAGAVQKLPDFRAMLDAALRGEITADPLPGGSAGHGGQYTNRSTRSLGCFTDLIAPSEAATMPPYNTVRRNSGLSAAGDAAVSAAAEDRVVRQTDDGEAEAPKQAASPEAGGSLQSEEPQKAASSAPVEEQSQETNFQSG